MDKYLIEVPHGEDKDSCRRAIQIFLSSGSHFVTNAEWGCMDGDHKAWLIVEVEDKKSAMMILPPAYRRAAKITLLHRFTREEIGEPDVIMDHHT